MSETYDVIVIGAGNAGLAAAVTTAQRGLKTLLLERNAVPGGCATSFRRGRFEFEPTIHEIAQVGSLENPGSIRKLFDSFGIQIDWRIQPILYRAIATCEGGFDVSMPMGIEAFCDEMERQVPGCRDSICRVFDCAMKAVSFMATLRGSKTTVERKLQENEEFLRIAGHSTDECLDALGVPKRAQQILTVYWPYAGEPTDRLSFLTFVSVLLTYVTCGAAMPPQRGHELSMALEEAFLRSGGQVRYHTEVDEVLVENGAVCGVRAGDQVFRTKQVISNAYPNRLFGSMIAKEDVPPIELQRINARELSLSFVNLYLGLNRSAEVLGIRDYCVFLLPSPDSVEQYERSFTLGGTGWLVATCPNLPLPDCSPEDTCMLSLMTSVYGDVWAHVAPEDYHKTKTEIAAQIIDYYERSMGISIRPYIEEIEIATPATFARVLGTPNGTPYGYRNYGWDAMLPRFLRREAEQSIRGLRFCGAFGERLDGFNGTYLCGNNAGLLTIRDIREERYHA